MKIIKNKVISFLLILVLLFASLSYYFFQYPNPSNLFRNQTLTSDQFASLENSAITSIPKSQVDLSSIDVSGWLPSFGMPQATKSVKNNKELFKRIDPQFYGLNSDGSLNLLDLSFPDREILSFAKTNNIKVYPTISSSNGYTLNQILVSDKNSLNLVQNIINEILKYNYDGIDLDIEAIEYSDHTSLYTFLKTLSTVLHKYNKQLIFTAIAKWGDYLTYWSLNQTRKTLDYKKISDNVDEIKIMAYEYYGRASLKAGPASPIKWDELLIQYAIYKGVPRSKINLGVPLYGYDKADRLLADDNLDFVNIDDAIVNTSGLEDGDAVYYNNIENIIKNYSMTTTFNTSWGAAIGKYIYKNQKRVVVYTDEQSIQMYKQLSADYGIKGITYWSLGFEGNLKL